MLEFLVILCFIARPSKAPGKTIQGLLPRNAVVARGMPVPLPCPYSCTVQAYERRGRGRRGGVGAADDYPRGGQTARPPRVLTDERG